MSRKKGRGSASATQRFVEALEERTLLTGVLVKDINTATASSSPSNIIALGSSVLFFADDGINGKELWKADASGATRLTDFPSTATVASPVRMNGFVYFTVTDASATKIWRTDGSAANTFAITDSLPGFVQFMTVVGSKLFFVSGDAINGARLWSTAGLQAGGEQVLKQFTGRTGNLTDVDGTLFFSTEVASGSQLWKSDGTDIGTVKVKDFPAGAGIYVASTLLIGMGGILYFEAGHGLWRSDGTDAGTFLLKTINPTGQPIISSMVSSGTRLFFNAYSSFDQELWESDGTEAGTVRVKDIRPGSSSSSPFYLTVFNGLVYFSANDGVHGTELWRSDGTDAGTFMVLDAVPGSSSSSPKEIKSVGGALYYQATTAIGAELWKSDGTAQGTAQFADIYSGLNSSSPAGFADAQGTVYFSAKDNLYGTELWKTDGSAAGTEVVADINRQPIGSFPEQTINVNGTLFFVATSAENGQELWKTDGTAAGTNMLKDIFPGPDSSRPDDLIKVGNILFFSATDATGRGLWKSDGTPAGTVFVSDQDIEFHWGDEAVALGNTLYYVSQDSTHGYELWKSDGTSAGTVLIKDVNLTGSTDRPEHLTVYNGKVYFAQNSVGYGRELWVTDGTALGTVLVKDIYVGTGNGFPGGRPYDNPVIYQGLLYFAAQTAQYGPELWRTNGTDAGTVMVYDSNPTAYGYGLLPHDLHVVGDYLYMAGDDDVHGDELWRTDGTSYGTKMVKDIYPGVSASGPDHMVDLNGILYFRVYEPVHGYALWRSDGTTNGTYIVDDAPGAPGLPWYVLVAQNRLWFTADPPNGSSGLPGGLWISDGTAQGTQLLHDVQSPFFAPIAQYNGAMFFPGYEAPVGEELYKIPLPAARPGGPYEIAAGNTLVLDGSLSSDADGNSVAAYAWDLDGDGIYGETGSAAQRGDETGPHPNFSTHDLVPGLWTVSLGVMDSQGIWEFAPVNITVKIPDFMVLSPDALISWQGVPGNQRIELTRGTLVLNGSIHDVYPSISLFVYNAASVQIDANQDLVSLIQFNFSQSSLANGVVLRTKDVVLYDSSHMDIGSARIEQTYIPDTMYWTTYYIQQKRLESSIVIADHRLAMAVYQPPSGIIVVEAALKGDLNVDGRVSISDFIDLSSNFGRTNATWSQGDINSDGVVSIADFITLSSNFGQTYSPQAPPPQSPAAITITAPQSEKLRKHRPHHRRQATHLALTHRNYSAFQSFRQ